MDILITLFGGRVAAYVWLSLYHHGRMHASGIKADGGLSLSAVQTCLQRYENQGLLVSTMAGRTRLYMFNRKNPFIPALESILKIAYETTAISERERLFPSRRRPRRVGKPVIPHS